MVTVGADVPSSDLGGSLEAEPGQRGPGPVRFAERVAIVGGTGRLGGGLARRLHQAGVDVVIGSRDPAKAAQVATALGLPAQRGRANRDAAAAAAVVIVTVPYEAHRVTLGAIAGAVSGKVVVDTTVPFAAGTMVRPEAGSAAREAASLLPGGRVVAGFHTVSSAMLADLSRSLRGDVLLCGDDAAANDVVGGLVRTLGMRPVDAGGLASAAILEQLAGLLLTLNRRYKRKDLGIQIVGLD